jgi:iron complex outermembrane receptor protein
LAHYEPFNIPEPYSDRFTMWTLNANYKFEGFDVTSVTSDWTRSGTATQESSEVTNFTFFGLPSVYPAAGGAGPSSFTNNDQTRQFTEELRAASSGDSRFQWQGGLFYSAFTSVWNYYSFDDGLIPLFGTNDLYTQFQPQTLDQKAAFGELSYRILDGLKVTVGGRYFEYTSTVDTVLTGILSATGGPNQLTIDTSGKAHGIDPKFNLSYDVNKDLMLYTTAERGFRPGGGNQPVPVNGTLGTACAANLKANGLDGVPVSFNPDSLWSYELGEKYKIGNTVTLNGAIYHERWSNVQQLVGLPCGFIYEDNSGTAVVNGGELEAKAFLTSHWEAAANFGYSKSYFNEANKTTGTVEGQELYDIPLMTASGALTYFFKVSADWQGSVRGSYNWTDRMSEPKSLVPSGQLPSHGFAGLRATVFNDHWTVAAFVNNLTNKHAEIEAANVLSAPTPTYQRITTNQPLTVGVDVNVKF